MPTPRNHQSSRHHRVKPPVAKTGYCGSSLPILKQGYSPPWDEGLRLWLIEVSNSTLAYHLGEKARYYGGDRIPECWVVNLPHRSLWVDRQPTDEGDAAFEATKTGTVSPLSFLDLAIEIGRFWP